MKSPSKSFRSSTSSHATIRLDDGATVVCIVKDLSAGGAKLQLAEANVVPERFQIEVGDLNVSAEADLVWRQGDLMGIRFVARQNAAAGRAAGDRSTGAQHAIGLANITSPRRFG